MMKFVDDFLNTITMYRLVLYYLISLAAVAVVFSFLGVLAFNGIALGFTVLFLIAVGWMINTVFAKVLKAVTNVESVYISALILSLIIPPFKNLSDIGFLFFAAVLTMSSKFIFAKANKHFFNPVALAVFLTAVALGRPANWWVGTAPLLPFVAIGGFLIVRKIKRFGMVVVFLGISMLIILGSNLISGGDALTTFRKMVLFSPWVFFASVMLTEPLTTPPTKKWQIIYGGLVGFLFAPPVHIGNLYTTPESALLLGNIFSYLVSPKEKLIFALKQRVQLSPDIFDFIFAANKKINFQPGQYLEWTLSHNSPDSRGNRRFFTIASSPTENDLRIGIKFNNPASSFKKSLINLPAESKILAGQLSGDFILPKEKNKKLVFIAGGIGITPFRSMLKCLLDKNERRDIILFYGVKKRQDAIYSDTLKEAQEKLGIKTVYCYSDEGQRLSEDLLKKEAPDFKDRIFYLSGPRSLVTNFEDILQKSGISKKQIRTDYFPGFV